MANIPKEKKIKNQEVLTSSNVNTKKTATRHIHVKPKTHKVQ